MSISEREASVAIHPRIANRRHAIAEGRRDRIRSQIETAVAYLEETRGWFDESVCSICSAEIDDLRESLDHLRNCLLTLTSETPNPQEITQIMGMLCSLIADIEATRKQIIADKLAHKVPVAQSTTARHEGKHRTGNTRMRDADFYDHPYNRAVMDDLDDARSREDRQLWELIYFSTCSLREPVGFLEEIRVDASRRNQARGITGLLAHKDGSLVQVLEGPKCEIADTFERFILPSRKHWSVTPVVSESIAKRSFEGWSLACRDLRNEETLPLEAVMRGVLTNNGTSLTARAFLKAFLE